MAKATVFANGRSIACKAVDGKSTAAFPDPCWSPPGPKAGWVVVPYANTAKAKHTANASKTVFIGGKPVMLKDKSYFKTSTGNEAAAGPKGLSSGVKEGKAYFASWSMNVKVEGYNVCRHMDMITHNHGSYPSNTKEWKYLDGGDKNTKDCKRDRKRIEKACGVMPKKCKKGNCKPTKLNSWKKRHCKGLGVKVSSIKGPEDLNELINETKESLKEFDVINAAVEKAKAEITKMIAKKGAKIIAKSALKGWLGPVGWLWTAYDAYEGVMHATELLGQLDAMKREANEFKDAVANFDKNIGELYNDLKNNNIDGAAGKVADMQEQLAKANPCLSARKCMLTSYSSSKKSGKTSPSGCCGGQTGHHVIPNSYMHKGAVTYGKKICSGYKADKAPVICVEGTKAQQKRDSNGNLIHTAGSHGEIHRQTDAILKSYDTGDRISYTKARDTGIKAIRDSFPFAGCSAGCLKKQLDNYYREACKNETTIGRRAGLPRLEYCRICGQDGIGDKTW